MPVIIENNVMPQDNTVLRQKLADVMNIQNQKRYNNSNSEIHATFFAQN